MTRLQDFDTLWFPAEWTEISATLTSKCVGCRSLKDCRRRSVQFVTLVLRLDDDFASRASMEVFPGSFLCLAVMPLRRFFSCNVAVNSQESGVVHSSAPTWTSRKPLTRPNTLLSAMLCWQKGVPILDTLWSQSSMLFELSQLRAARAMLVDEILGSLISEWTAQGVEWLFDQLLMTSLTYANDVLLFADSLEKLTRMFNDCCASFERAGSVPRKLTGVLPCCWTGSRCGLVDTMCCGSAL